MTKSLKYEDLKIGKPYWILQLGSGKSLYLFEATLEAKYSTTEFDIYGQGSTEKQLKIAHFEQYWDGEIDLHFVLKGDEYTNATWGDKTGFFFKTRKGALNFLFDLENKQ